VKIESVSRISTNDEVVVVLFRFIKCPEFIQVGSRILFRDGGRTNGIGQITDVFPFEAPILN